MNIDTFTIAAVIVFVVAVAIFVKNCFVNSCIREGDRKRYKDNAADSGNK